MTGYHQTMKHLTMAIRGKAQLQSQVVFLQHGAFIGTLGALSKHAAFQSQHLILLPTTHCTKTT